MPRYWKTTEEAELIRMVKAGIPASKIAERLQRTPHAVYQRGHALGLSFTGYNKTHNRKVTDRQIAWARYAIKSGKSRDEIQAKLGISRNYLNMILRGERR